MKSQIKKLNQMYIDGIYTYARYYQEAAKLLAPLDWQSRIQFQNSLFVSYVD